MPSKPKPPNTSSAPPIRSIPSPSLDARPPTTTAKQSLLSSSLTSLTFLIALQLFSRLFTSFLNTALLRLASPKAFGTAAIQFELVLSTILVVSREGVRNAILRSTTPGINNEKKKGGEGQGEGGNEDSYVKQMNLTFLPLLLGIPLSLLTSYLYLATASSEVRAQPHLNLAVGIYAVAALLELAGEPMHNRAMLELKTDVRVRAEGLGITVKSLVTLAVLYIDAQRGQDDLALVAFALGQLAYATSVWRVYAKRFGGFVWLRKLQVKRGLESEGYFDSHILNLSVTMTAQSVVKHVLTEGDKLMLTFFSPLGDQGGYAIAANYGSLLARIIFQPLEETLRLYFSKLLTSPSSSSLSTASSALTSLLITQTSISLLFVLFGSSYLPFVLPLVLPPKYTGTSAGSVLGAWVYLIPWLSLNGSLEAFLSSAAGAGEVRRQSKYMFAFSVIYISTASYLYRLGWGDVSLIYANCVNLAARVAYCVAFARRFLNQLPISSPQDFVPSKDTHTTRDTQPTVQMVEFHVTDVLPRLPFLLAVSASAVLIPYSANHFDVASTLAKGGKYAVLQRNVLMHVAVGGVLGVGCLGVWWVSSGKRVLASVREQRGGKMKAE